MKYLSILFSFLFCSSLHAQQYYYNGSEKVTVYESENSFITYDNPSPEMMNAFSEVKPSSSKGFTILIDKKETTSMKQLRTSGLNQITPALKMENQACGWFDSSF